MKEIVMSIKPKWWRLIASGDKTVEIRKTAPRHPIVPFKVFVYITKPEQALLEIVKDGDDIYGDTYHGKPIFVKTYKGSLGNLWGRTQTIIGEFDCVDIEPLMLSASMMPDVNEARYMLPHIGNACLSLDDLDEYGRGKKLYGWKIANVKQYADPKPLSAFGLSLPPQSWCYVKRYAACGGEMDEQ